MKKKKIEELIIVKGQEKTKEITRFLFFIMLVIILTFKEIHLYLYLLEEL